MRPCRTRPSRCDPSRGGPSPQPLLRAQTKACLDRTGQSIYVANSPQKNRRLPRLLSAKRKVLCNEVGVWFHLRRANTFYEGVSTTSLLPPSPITSVMKYIGEQAGSRSEQLNENLELHLIAVGVHKRDCWSCGLFAKK